MLRSAEVGDITRVHSIEMSSIQDPWSEKMLAAHLKGNANIFVVAEVAESSQYAVVGFVIVQVVADQAEVLNIAVDLEYRRFGIASLLLAEVETMVAERGADKLFLEVRESNEIARLFYTRRCFRELGRRKQYYQNPTEDAIILQKQF